MPVAVGTPEVECLTGYLQRLANAWTLPPVAVFQRWLVPALLTQKNWKDRITVLLERNAALMNGCREVAEISVRELSRLTRRQDLGHCTWIQFSKLEGLSSARLLAPGMRWCPQCWRSDGPPGHRYVRKLWTLSIVDACHIHGTRLHGRCHACARRQPFIARDVEVGVCASCGTDLCEAESIPSSHSMSCSSMELFYAQQAASLLAAIDISSLLGCCRESLCAARKQGMAELKDRLSETVGESSSVVRRLEAWQEGVRRPSLEELFSVLWRAQWPVLGLFPAEVQMSAGSSQLFSASSEDT